MKLSSFRVRGGQKVRLSAWDTSETGDLNKELAKAESKALQDELASLQERLYAESSQSLLVILQARDAGGKDGTVKHVFSRLNPQGVVVTSFKAPTPEEQAHDFLWRVHAHTPAAGMMAVFNRSHYEDVLVPRVHGNLDSKAAKARYTHINAFEELLANRGTRVLKLYLHISASEQKDRLQDRLDDPEKRWKFNPGDLKERALWDQYTSAYEDALRATSTDRAPWYVIPADHNWYRNLLISRLLVETLNDMKPQFPAAQFSAEDVTIE